MGTRYFKIESVSYPLGITVKFMKNEINYYMNKGINPKLCFCECGTEPKEITKQEFLKLVKEYEK